MSLRPTAWLTAISWSIAAILGLLPLSASPASAAKAFKVRLLLDSTRLRPDTGQPFLIVGTPVIDGDRVVFVTIEGACCNLDAIWSIDINNKAVRKLAGTGTPVPHEPGSFHDFNYGTPTVGGGQVAFFATANNSVRGIYTVPVAGGTIHRVVSTRLKAPDGGKFDDLPRASLNGTDVVFFGHTSIGRHGIYRAMADGTQLATVIDEKTKLAARSQCSVTGGRVANYDHPVIGAGAAAFIGLGNDAAVNGPNGVYTATSTLADNFTHLQSDPGPCPHIVFTALSAAVQNGQIAFGAFDATVHDPDTGIPFEGIFLARGVDKAATRFVANTQKSENKQLFGVFAGFGYDDSGLAFTATEGSGGLGVYFIGAPGEPIHTLAREPDFYQPNAGDRSVSGGVVTFSAGHPEDGLAIWIATPIVN